MKKTILLLALFGLIAVMTGCQKGEEITVSQYFEAMKHNDKDTMASMAIEPRDIEYKKFEIVSVDEPVVSELELPKLQKKLEQLNASKKKQVDLAMEKKYALEDIQDELDETRRREKKTELEEKKKAATEDMEVERAKLYQMVMDINATKKAIGVEKSMMKASTGIDRNFEIYTGESIKGRALVKITKMDGGIDEYIFFLQKFNLTLEERPRKGRLVITKITTQAELDAKESEVNPDPAEAPAEEVTEGEAKTDDAAQAEETKTEEEKK